MSLSTKPAIAAAGENDIMYIVDDSENLPANKSKSITLSKLRSFMRPIIRIIAYPALIVELQGNNSTSPNIDVPNSYNLDATNLNAAEPTKYRLKAGKLYHLKFSGGPIGVAKVLQSIRTNPMDAAQRSVDDWETRDQQHYDDYIFTIVDLTASLIDEEVILYYLNNGNNARTINTNESRLEVLEW